MAAGTGRPSPARGHLLAHQSSRCGNSVRCSGVSHPAAHRVIDTVGPLLALAPVRRRRIDQVAIVDGTLVPTRDHRLAARSKNYRYSTNLQVAIDADTRLVIATGDPQPGNRNDCTGLPRLRYRRRARRPARHGGRRLPGQTPR